MDGIPVVQCQWRLTYVWMIGVGVSFALLLAQTFTGKFGDQSPRAWSWFLPAVLPTLTLIVGSLVYQSRSASPGATADPRLYRLSSGLSAIYLILVLFVLLSAAFPGPAPIERMTQSQIWVSPVQALVTSALGAFFVSKKE